MRRSFLVLVVFALVALLPASAFAVVPRNDTHGGAVADHAAAVLGQPSLLAVDPTDRGERRLDGRDA